MNRRNLVKNISRACSQQSFWRKRIYDPPVTMCINYSPSLDVSITSVSTTAGTMVKTISTSVSIIFRTFHVQCYLKTGGLFLFHESMLRSEKQKNLSCFQYFVS
ncbi:uncharacterized protein LOC120358253 [Solenopsis invicta]|uniref:uncharacterized protein LOC120358253 n=1 Tax=Solenopsis invicta TaxID=13686 RepID=UPI00193E3ED5|nr:uncharacterized protein LOC120358253 [Solenopsis invicta]